LGKTNKVNTLEGICHGCGKYNDGLKVKNEPKFPSTVYCPDCYDNYRKPIRIIKKTQCKNCLKDIAPRELAIQTGKDHYLHVRCVLKDKTTDWKCPKCGHQLWLRWTRWKRILNCSSCGFVLDRVPRDGKPIKVFDLNKEWTQEENDEFIKRITGKK
jgi:ssDNA-binding Zn-finger/Zn-ribbon topoisomerase 1